MLSLERHRRVLDLLQQGGSVRVTELAGRFDVTEETIRRDLDRLALAGKLVRTHGGALPVRSEHADASLVERQTRNLDAKVAIGRAAAARVEQGDTIMLDASSTAIQLAKILPDAPLTVITHALSIAMELATRRQIRTIVIGGLIDPESLSLVGPLATQCLDAYHVNKLFLSCQGIDLQRGLSVGSEQQADLKRRMLADADQRILLADHSKFGVKSTCYFGTLEDIDRVITDDGADENLLAELREEHVEVQVVKRG